MTIATALNACRKHRRNLEEDIVSTCDSKVMGVEEAVLDDKAVASQFLPVGPKLCDANGHVCIPKRLEQAAQQKRHRQNKLCPLQIIHADSPSCISHLHHPIPCMQ